MDALPVPPFTQIGIPLSYYSAKLRSYLLQKGIPFRERGPTLVEFAWTMKRRTGAAAVPVLLTHDGQWLQDTSATIDALERRFPQRPALPDTPVQRFAAYLLELWADEFWLPVAMHARWSHPENVPFFVEDAARHMLPGTPLWLRRRIARRVAGRMQSYLPAVGVSPAQHGVMDAFLRTQLDALETHFARHRFLLGERITLADHALAGPMWAHIGRDPWPRRELVEPRPHLLAWTARTMEPAGDTGALAADDTVPGTLAPALRSTFDEMVPFLRACCEAVRTSPVQPGTAPRARRSFGPVDYPLAGGTHRRLAGSYPVWMLRRLMAAFEALDAGGRQRVRDWLAAQGGSAILALDPPPVRRVGLAAAHVAPGDADAFA